MVGKCRGSVIATVELVGRTAPAVESAAVVAATAATRP